MEETKVEEPFWECPCCGYEMIKEADEKPVGILLAVLAVSGEAGPLLAQVCPHCKSISLSEQTFDGLSELTKNKIVKPSGVVI